MPNFFTKLKNRFTSSTPSKSKSTGDLATTSAASLAGIPSEYYTVKDSDLPKLHKAAWKGNIDKVIELCRPDKVNLRDKEQRTPLHLAVAANHLDVTKHLLQEDAKIQVFDKDNRSPLIIAVLNSNFKMVKLLIDHLEQENLVNIPDKNGLTVLFYAIKAQNGLQILKLLFQKELVNKNLIDKDKNTALHFAIIQKNYEAIKLLVENGFEIDAQNADGRTPLMQAALSGDERLTEFLLESGADLQKKDRTGKTAVDWGMVSRNQKCIALLQQNRYSARTQSEGADDETDSADILRGEEKFEKMFTKKQTPSPEKSSRSASALKYQIAGENEQDDKNNDEDEDESHNVISDDKGPSSRDKSDKANTWINSEDEEESELVNDEFESKGKKEYANLFANIQLEKNKEKKEIKFEDLDPMGASGVESFENSQGENEDDQEDDEEWPEMPSTESIQQNFNTNNQQQATFSTFRPQSKTNEAQANWSIFIITGKVKNAGTDAGVYIQIYGTKSSSALMQLDRKIGNKKLFESGNCDKFDKNLPDIGKPVKIKIGHDNSGSFPGWFLDQVVLQNNITNEKYLFNCNRWLAKDELDHKIELELSIESGTNDSKNKLQHSNSWDSSEDEDDTTSEITKKSNPNLVKIVKESNFDKVFATKPESFTKAKKVDGPPEISDFEDSTEEYSMHKTPIKQISKTPEKKVSQDEESISFLINTVIPKDIVKSSPQKKNETIGKLISSIRPPAATANIDSNEEGDNISNKSLSIDALINSAEDMFDETKRKKSETTVKKPTKHQDDLSINSISPANSAREPTLSKLIKHDQRTTKPSSALAERIKNRRSLSIEDDFSQTDNKSQSIDGLVAKVDDILEQKKSPSKIAQKEGNLKEMIRTELKSNQNSFFEISPMHQTNNQTKITTSSTSPSNQNTTTLSSILRNDFKNVQSPQRELDSRIKTKFAQLDQQENELEEITLTKLVSNEMSKKNNFFKSIETKKATNITSIIKESKQTVRMFNDSEDENMLKEDEDDDEDFEDRFEISKNQSKISGAIGTAIGAAIESNANNSILQVQNKTNTFADLAVELYSENASLKSNSPEHVSQFSNKENLKAKQQELDQLKQLLDEMRRKNDQLSSEKQQLKLRLADTESKKNSYEEMINEKERVLMEKEQQIFELNTLKQKSEMASKLESNGTILLQKEIKELKEKNHELESKLSATRVAGIQATTAAAVDANQNYLRLSDELAQQPFLANQNEGLNNKVKLLEAQIEELNADREKLLIHRDELTVQLNEKENDVTTQKEALDRASLQYLMEKNSLIDENKRAKNDLAELSETKRRLIAEIESLKSELSEKKMKYDQLSLIRTSLEQQLDREKSEHEKHLQSCETEMRSLREQLMRINEKLSHKETNLISTENDLKYTRVQIEERQKQIDELKNELVRNKNEFALHLDLFRKEKEEKELLIKKCDALEESIKKNIEEINFWKTKHQRSLALEQNGLVNASELNLNDPSLAIEIENKRLQNEVKTLNEKLEKIEKELKEQKEENQNIIAQASKREPRKKSSKRSKSHASRIVTMDDSSTKKSSKSRRRDLSAASSSSSTLTSDSDSAIEKSKLKSELKNLKNDFKTIMDKYANEMQNQANSNMTNQGVNYYNQNQSFARQTQQQAQLQQPQQQQQLQRENIDVPGLITDLPLKTVANLNNYIIRNIIKQEQDPQEANNLHIVSSNSQYSTYKPSYSHEPITHLILTRKNNMYATSTDIPSVNDLIPTSECERCCRKSKSYIDSLKYELSKRIEFEATKDVPFSHSCDYRYNSTSTSNYDTLYNRLNENNSTSRLLSTQSNSDLLNSLRLKFLI